MGKDDDDPQMVQALKYREEVRRVLQRYSRNRSDTQELMQETYLRFLKAKRRPFANIESMGAFLRTIARNVGIDFAQKQQKMADKTEALEADALSLRDESADPERSVEALERLARLQRVIEKFPPQRRRVVELRRLEDRSRQEIAAMLGISESTVNSHLAAAAVELVAAWRGESS